MRMNIYHRKDGRFEGRIITGKVDKKRKYKAFFGRSVEEVQEKIFRFWEKIKPTEQIHQTFSEIYGEWFRSVELRIKESTAANYTLKAEKHILPWFGSKKITEISQEYIYQFIQEKQKIGLSNRYITDILTLMKSVFKYAAATYKIANPIDEITMPKKQKTEIRLFSMDEEKKLMQMIMDSPNLTTMGIALARMTGLRIGELCALQWKDVDLEKRILTVRKTIQRIQVKNSQRKTKLIITEPKSESSKRNIPIPVCILEFLRQFQGESEQFVLSGAEKPVEPRVIQYRFAKIRKKGNLPSVHFHALRHMFATHCIRAGFDIKTLSEILGHSSVEITLNRYVHSSFTQKLAYMDQLRLSV